MKPDIMKMNISLMKLTIRLLLLSTFFVISFIILAILYSTRYWPDIYNYINANITIKRIPTLSELDLTVLEVDFTTEYYSTSDYIDDATVKGIDISFDELTNTNNGEEKSEATRAKRFALEDFANDYSEVPTKKSIIDYFFLDESSTIHEDVFVTKIIKDLIYDSKLVPKNYADVEIMVKLNEIASDKMTDDPSSDVTSVFPWISTIFVKNDSKSNQFEYYCDGALLNERVLITAARCVMLGNSTVDPDSLLVILGKRSLLAMVDKEQAVKIKQIITHENFTNTNGTFDNDLALLVFESPVIFNDIIQPATFGNDTEEMDKSFTTAWNPQGELVPVSLEDKDLQGCNTKSAGGHVFCASYGLNVALCPSYGGIHAGYRTDGWKLYGIRHGDTTDRGLCFDKNVLFTDLREYEDWIMENVE